MGRLRRLILAKCFDHFTIDGVVRCMSISASFFPLTFVYPKNFNEIIPKYLKNSENICQICPRNTNNAFVLPKCEKGIVSVSYFVVFFVKKTRKMRKVYSRPCRLHNEPMAML